MKFGKLAMAGAMGAALLMTGIPVAFAAPAPGPTPTGERLVTVMDPAPSAPRQARPAAVSVRPQAKPVAATPPAAQSTPKPPAPTPGSIVPVRQTVPEPGDIRVGDFADTARVLTTRDGWKVTVSKYGEKLDSVPPLNRSPQSFEGFSNVGGQVTIVQADPKVKPAAKLKSVTLTTGVHVGCAVTADSATIGGSLSNATTASVTPTVTASGTVTGQGQGGSSGGQGGGSVSGTGTGSLSGTVSDTVTETGSISGVIKPGTTKDIPFAKKAVTGPNVQTMTRDVRIAVDNCIGGVQVRSYATVAISTDRTDDTVTTFGKPVFLVRP